ncbi:MAG: hypothetical protein NTV51_11290 [Verrucomicrobia bacterium]|nr:hypothetical protein [Verrucomicrobiota bacterium]
MSIPFYHTAARQAALLAEVRSWEGTPFSENCAVKGVQGGVSCERFQVAIHSATGACPPLDLPVIPVEQVRHWHEHHAGSLIMEFLRRPELEHRVRRLEPDTAPLMGDICVMRVGQTEHHLGVWCGPRIYHVAIPAGGCFYRLLES